MSGFMHDKFISRKADKNRVLDRTISVWQLHSCRSLNHEDAREIMENVVGFFQILGEWETKEKKRKNCS